MTDSDASVIEAMARAIFAEDSMHEFPDWDGQHRAIQAVWRSYARAALAAYRAEQAAL